MKTQIQQQVNSDIEKQSVSKQASAGTILQAYKNASSHQPATQSESYSETFTVQEDIVDSDIHDWGIMRRKLGVNQGSAANSAGSNANNSLTALGLKGTEDAMTAHMIPRRAGGPGNNTNVRPWTTTFEDGTWKDEADSVFNTELVGKKENETVTFAVTTTDMDDAYYDGLKERSTARARVKNNVTHKANIQAIPLEVSAEIGEESLGTTSECSEDLIA